MCVVNILNFVNATPTVKIVLNKGKQIWKPKGKLFYNSLNKTKQIWKPKDKLFDNSLNKTKQIWQPKGKLSDNSLNKTKQIWQPKGKLSDNSLNKTKQVWKATGKLFANVGYQWRPTGKKFTLGKLNCGYQWRPTGKKFALGELCTLTRLPVTCCSKLDLEESMAPVRKSSGPEPNMMFGQNSSSLVLHQMMSVQISSNLASQMSQRCLLASLQAPFLKEKKGVRFSARYLQQKRNLLVLDHSHQQVSVIRKGNLLLDLQKLQMNPIFRISVDIFVRAFTTSANVPSIYIQLFWNTLTHDAKTRVYSFQVDEHWLTLSADLLRKALNVTPADSAHPFESPPAGKTDITFTRRRVPSNWLMKMKFNRLLNLIWMIMSTIYNKTTRKLPVVEVKGKGSATDVQAAKWIIASQDETTGPSVHPEDATSTKMVRETLSHADAESGGNSEKINSETDTEILNVGSNSKQSHVALAGPNPEHMQDVFLATNYPKIATRFSFEGKIVVLQTAVPNNGYKDGKIKGVKKEALHTLKAETGSIHMLSESMLTAELKDDILETSDAMDNPSQPFEFLLKETFLRIILVILPEHPSDTKDHLKMEKEMEIPSSSNVKLITECSDTTYICYEVMKDHIKKLAQSQESSPCYELNDPTKGIVPTEMELVLEYTQQGASHEVSDHLKMEMEMEIPSVKASANSDIIFFFTSAQDGNKLLDDERLSLADDLKKAHDQNQNKSK
ncbi:hypothetical protein Tco_0956184 [Tanacetum coccineum]|uniref:Uncharacterized protein n=1 Tax=Tanacetum coccineum TaxID=301880 RepID=A0ABQ5E9C3_9ASTR